MESDGPAATLFAAPNPMIDSVPAEERPSRSVLMVLYFYPPLGGISMSRNTRNVQYLPRHGWIPTVLTPRHPAYHLQDPTSMRLIAPGTRVIRTGSVEAGHVRPTAVRLTTAASDLFGYLLGRGRHRRATRGSSDPTSRDAGSSPRLAERLRRLVFFPDDQIGWLPFAVIAAVRAHRRTPFDAIYSTSSPITSHLVAGMVKRVTGVPWIAEFRDPWIGNALAAPLPWFHRRLQVKLERWIVGSSDRVVGVSEGITNLYRTRYPSAPEMATITSGYDRGEARTKRERPGDAPFRIVYTGTLDRPVELGVFLDGLATFAARCPDQMEHLELHFYGSVSEACRGVVDRFASRGIGTALHFHGFVPRSKALDAVADSDSALILLGSGPGMSMFIGGKLFDYIGQDQQILAMLPRGDSRGILEELGWGVACDPEPDDVARAIETLLATRRPDRPADPTGKYDRVALAGRLARSLDEVAGQTEAAP